MKIQVTEQDIELGIQTDVFNCMVARAIKRLGFETPIVHYGSARIGNEIYRFPREVAERIHRFDLGMKVTPFEFEAEKLAIFSPSYGNKFVPIMESEYAIA